MDWPGDVVGTDQGYKRQPHLQEKEGLAIHPLKYVPPLTYAPLRPAKR